MAESFDLTSEAILVRLYIGQAGITASSRTLTREAAANHKADPAWVNGTITKITAEARKDLVKVMNAARAMLYTNTLPWDENAYRMVPISRYAYLRREMDKLRNDFDDAVQNLVSRYTDLKKQYISSVGDLAQEVPFPTVQELAGNFRFELYEMPLANPHDFRLKHVSQTTVNELKSKITSQMNERLAVALAEIVERMKANVAKLKQQTADNDSRLFKSLVSNIEKDCDVLPKLNLTNDPEITRLIERVRAELAGIDVTAMRGDNKNAQKLRGHIHKTASSVLDDLQNYGQRKVVAVSKPKPETKIEPIAEAAVKAQGKAKKGFDFGKFGSK